MAGDCKYLIIKNWNKHQHYKKRNPPWIKLHGSLFIDDKFMCLQDASKLHLIAIWVLARIKDGVIPNDPKWIKKAAGLDGDIDLTPLIESGFLIPSNDASILSSNASTTLATCYTETETETETEKRKECVSNVTDTCPIEAHTHNSSKVLTEAERIHRSYCLRRWGDSWDANQESAKSLKEIREIESRLEAMPSARAKLEAYFANPPPGRLATEPLYQIFQYLELDQKNTEKKQNQRPSQTYKDFTAERLASQFKA